MNRSLVVAAVIVLLGGGAGAWWLLGQDTPTVDPLTANKADKKVDDGGSGQPAWQLRWDQLGLAGTLAERPDADDPVVAITAKKAGDAAGIAALLKQHATAGELRALPSTQVRRHPVRGAGALLAALADGNAKPAHDIEVAWLAAALLRKLDKPVQFITESAGVQTPVLLSRARVGVRSEGVDIVPLGDPLKAPQVLPEDHAVGWWLIQKAYVQRAGRNFAAAHSLLAAARALGAEAAADYARGVVEMDQGVFDKGLQRCVRALAVQDDPMARLFLADVLNQVERPFKAWEQVDAVLKKHPELAEAHASKGILEAARVATLPEQDKAAALDKAAVSLRKALQLDPAVAGARAGLAQVLLLKGQNEEAEKLLVEAVEKHRDYAAASILGELWRNPAQADALIAKLAPLNDGELRVAMALAGAHAARSDLAGALAAVETAHKASPDDPDLGLLRADLLRQNGKTAEAIAALEGLRKAAPDGQVALLQAQLLMQTQKVDDAIAILAPIAKRKPAKDNMLLLLMAYAQAGKAMEMEATIGKALDKGLMTPVEVAGALIELGDADNAVTLLEKSLQAKPSTDAAQMLAMILTASGKRKEAEAMRDRVAAKAGELAGPIREAVNEAIQGAEAELKAMAAEDASAGEPKKAP